MPGGILVNSAATALDGSTTAAIHFFVGDQVGTAQMEFAGGGWPIWRGEFTPFGSPVNNNITTNNYKFTGQERDSESADFTGTGLDFMNARYYSSTLGRFTSPDPYLGSIHLWNPQSLNRYTYALNKPLSMFDPSGMIMQCAMATQDYISTTDYSDGTQMTSTRSMAVMDCQDDGEPEFGDALLSAPSYSGDTDASSKSVLGCAAKFASAHSIAGGLQSLGIGSHGGVGGFLTNTFGGNTFAGLYNLGSTLTSSSSTDQQVLTQMGKAYLRGPLQGIPASLVGASGSAAVSPVGMARRAALSSALNAVTGADESLITLSGETALSTVGTTAAEFATGVGEAKFALDFLTFAVGVGTCIP